METTFRVVDLRDPRVVGRTAATVDLAKLAAGHLDRSERLGVEQTDWEENFGKMKVHRTILIDAEDRPGQWVLGTDAPTGRLSGL
jgi:hypothetical protein